MGTSRLDIRGEIQMAKSIRMRVPMPRNRDGAVCMSDESTVMILERKRPKKHTISFEGPGNYRKCIFHI